MKIALGVALIALVALIGHIILHPRTIVCPPISVTSGGDITITGVKVGTSKDGYLVDKIPFAHKDHP